jgi:hypothetical protein
MKYLKPVILTLSLMFLVFSIKAQDVQGEASDFAVLKGEKTINVEFVYEKVAVGDYSKESEYVKKKTEEMNAKEPKSGDAWAVKWEDAKHDIYHPKFLEYFTKYSEMTLDTAAKYTLIFKINFIEPGYQIAISKKSAQVEGTILLVQTSNKTKKLATLTVEREKGKYRGGSFDFAGRIAETYGVTGRETGKLIKKAVK